MQAEYLVDVTGIEPVTPCLQSEQEKTLNSFVGVAYTSYQQDSRSRNIPKLYRRVGEARSRQQVPWTHPREAVRPQQRR